MNAPHTAQHTGPALQPASPQALRLQRRVAALEAAFRTVARTRMAGVPVLNPALQVRALGFGLHTDAGDAPDAWAMGLLVTPWFMNLVRLPLRPGASVPAVGASVARLHGGLRFDFLGAHEAAVGPYEACSLFSPMFEFADQAAAEAVAYEVLAQLGAGPVGLPPAGAGLADACAARPAAAQAQAQAQAQTGATSPPARRRFLLGRGAAGAGR